MKNLIFALLLLIVGCSKKQSPSIDLPEEIPTAKPNYDLFYHTCANGYSDQTVGAEGVAASANVEKLRLGNAMTKSWWIGAFYFKTRSDGLREKYWVQWGYFVDRFGLGQAFYVYQIFPNYSLAPPFIIYSNQTVPLEYGTRVRFEMQRVPGTTLWSFLRNGQKVFDADLGVTSFDGVLQSCTESRGNDSFAPNVHVDYLDFYRNGQWQHLPSGNISSISWNLQGSSTRPDFQQSEHEFGGRLPGTINYLLW